MPTAIHAIVLVATFGSALTVVAYETFARARGWPVGALLSGDAPLLKIGAFVAGLNALIAAVNVSWWLAPVTVIGGFLSRFFSR